MKRVGVLSNPRSGTSLMTYLLLAGFDLSEFSCPFVEFDGSNIYHYRIDARQVNTEVKDEFFLIHIIRDPRAVATSVHPNSAHLYPNGVGCGFTFEKWIVNHLNILNLSNRGNVYVKTIKFEDLLVDVDYTQKKIFDFLKVPVICEFTKCYAMKNTMQGKYSDVSRMEGEMGGIRPFSRYHAFRWKEEKYQDRLASEFNKTPEIIKYLIDLGYM